MFVDSYVPRSLGGLGPPMHAPTSYSDYWQSVESLLGYSLSRDSVPGCRSTLGLLWPTLVSYQPTLTSRGCPVGSLRLVCPSSMESVLSDTSGHLTPSDPPVSAIFLSSQPSQRRMAGARYLVVTQGVPGLCLGLIWISGTTQAWHGCYPPVVLKGRVTPVNSLGSQKWTQN